MRKLRPHHGKRSWLLGAMLASALFGCAGRRDLHEASLPPLPSPALQQLPALAVEPCPGKERARVHASFTLALPGTVAPEHAPLPLTEAERHVFGNCYEPLVRITCDGDLEPALAKDWRAYDGARTWVFRLRDDARFWDGTPLGAVHVIEAWRRAEALCRLHAEPSPFIRFDPRGVALEVRGPRELAVHLAAPGGDLPWLLAHPALAVTGDLGPDGWLTGSGPFQPAPPAGEADWILVPVASHPAAASAPPVALLLGDRRDPREHLDLGADAVLTKQRAVVEYYTGLGRHRVEPLPWDRTYYLVTPSEETGADALDRRRWATGWDRLELAREVVTEAAEPAAFFGLEPQLAPCPVLPPPVQVLAPPSLGDHGVLASRDTDLILWPQSDPEAGRLAERLAALAARPLRPGPDRPGLGPLTPPVPPQPGVAPEAVAVPAADLAAHIQAARAGAFILPWPQRWPLPCDDLARMLSLADWLLAAGLSPGPDIRAVPPGATAARPVEDSEPPQALAVARRLERSQAVQPLLRTRAYLIRSPGLAGLQCSYDGTLRFWTAGWLVEPPPQHK
ncbi:MAG: ABC transporter substrate-binding protein [Candidatus Krumholzibacteria bacterium]|nr:ABC transporter substrate-binding protein [Candidatus Krumholzibacteria bacterium]